MLNIVFAVQIDIGHPEISIPKKPSETVVEYFVNESGFPAFIHAPRKIQYALSRKGITTIEELDRLSEVELQRIRYLGTKGVGIILAWRKWKKRKEMGSGKNN